MWFKRILVACFACTTLFACSDLPCGRASALVVLLSFTDMEADSVVIRRYHKGSGFSFLADTLLLRRGVSHFSRRGDTLLVLEAFSDIESAFDYEIDLPRAGRLFRLTEIYEPQTWDRHRKTYCINPIRSYRLDGQLVSGEEQYNRIYLRK